MNRKGNLNIEQHGLDAHLSQSAVLLDDLLSKLWDVVRIDLRRITASAFSGNDHVEAAAEAAGKVRTLTGLSLPVTDSNRVS